MKVSTTGPDSFDRIAAYLWSENQSEGAPATPPIVLENPLGQLWIETAKGMLPAELAGHLDQADSVQACMDWLGVAVIYRQLSGSRLERKAFLTELDGNPDPARVLNAAIAARTAVQTQPTLRDRDWVRLDWLGVAMQMVLLGLLLCARSAVMHLAALEWPRLEPCFGPALHYFVPGGDGARSAKPPNGLGLAGSPGDPVLPTARFLRLQQAEPPCTPANATTGRHWCGP